MIGHNFEAFSSVSMLYFFNKLYIFYPISMLYKSRYICESFASMRMPPNLPSGFLFPWCFLLNAITLCMTSYRVEKENLKSKTSVLPSTKACFIFNYFNSFKANSSAHQSFMTLLLYCLTLFLILCYGKFSMFVILDRKGSCITRSYFSFVRITSSSIKSAPM